MDTLISADIFQFGNFRLDRRGGGLFQRNEQGSFVPVAIGSRALELLGVLSARAGDVVSKQEIMNAVWSGKAVEDSNLTVQLSALRRILDAERAEGSCIQTVPGRGYRFICPVTRVAEAASVPVPATAADAFTQPAAGPAPVRVRRQPWRRFARGLGGAAIVAVLIFAAAWHGGWFSTTRAPPPLSLVVLPFENLSGDPKDDYLADGITDDLTTNLAYIPNALVIARESAYTYKGKPKNVRKIGEELGLRYVLEGSVRRIESTLRVDVRLTSAKTGAQLWSDRFDEQITNLAAGQEQIVTQIGAALGISLVEIESARSLR